MGIAALEVTAVHFLCGPLCHPPLLQAVLGRKPEMRSGRLAGHAVHWAEGRDAALAFAAPGSAAEGVLVEGLTAGDQHRLAFYTGEPSGMAEAVAVEADGTEVMVHVVLPGVGLWRIGAPFRLDDWLVRSGDLEVALAEDVMALCGQAPAEAVARRRGVMRVRAASRLRARTDPAPATVRRATGPGAVTVITRTQPYARFFAVEEYDLRYPRFDGADSAVVNRAAFISGDAVTVLPYDPVRDRVLLVEQFRAGPFARGDRRPWSLEAVAGRIDPGETPETAARREAQEEAGLVLDDLLPVASYYSSPGAKIEFLYSFVALADLPDGAAGIFGLEEEAEDIRGHLVSFEALMSLVATGEVNNGPLILTALWLERERARLRRRERSAGSPLPGQRKAGPAPRKTDGAGVQPDGHTVRR